MKRILQVAAPAALLALSGSAVLAQGGFGGPPNPAMMAKFQAWQKWRQSHPNVSSVQRTVRGIEMLEKDPNPALHLNKAQGAKVLAVLTAWRNKPVMTDDQARHVAMQLTSPLNTQQLKKLATAQMPGQGGRGFGGGGFRPGGGPGGGRPGGPGRGNFQMPDPREYNPLNPDSNPMAKLNPEMGNRIKQGMNDLIAHLKAGK